MNRRAGTTLAITTAVLLAGRLVAAQTTPAGTAPPRSSTPWNTATTRPPPPPTPAASDSTLSLRVYDGVNSSSPLPYSPRPADDPAYAVDVSAIMSRCADGRLVITALLIGGHLTPLDTRCSNEPGPATGTAAPQPKPAATPIVIKIIFVLQDSVSAGNSKAPTEKIL